MKIILPSKFETITKIASVCIHSTVVFSERSLAMYLAESALKIFILLIYNKMNI